MGRLLAFCRAASWFAVGLLITAGLARPAFAAYYSTDKVWWDYFVTSCNNCTPTVSVTAWAYPDTVKGAPFEIGVVQSDPPCSNERYSQALSDYSNNGNNYLLRTTMVFPQVSFCSTFVGGTWQPFPVTWRVAWSHQ